MKHDLTVVEISNRHGEILFGETLQKNSDNLIFMGNLKEFFDSYDMAKNDNEPLELVIEHYKKV